MSGRTQDLNIAYIGKGLEKLGIVLAEVVVIPDVEETIIDRVRSYSNNYDYVFTTGAPGFQINNVFVLAGVPDIMRSMFDALTERLIGGPPILTASVFTNLTESKLAEGMKQIQEACPAVSIGSYPYFKRGKLGVNIILRSTDKELLLEQSDLIGALIDELGGKVFEKNNFEDGE